MVSRYYKLHKIRYSWVDTFLSAFTLICIALSFSYCLYCSEALANENNKLRIGLIAPKYGDDPHLSKIVGTTWEIYLEGEIDKEAPQRLESEIKKHKIKQARVYFNSPGGALLSGIEAGRLIRKYGFDTYVGKQQSTSKTKSEFLPSLPGECYSACVLAYVGGYHRYFNADSKMGVHRFHNSSMNDASGMDIAQILSAAIMNYLKEMEVDVALFDRMSRAGKDSIYLLSEKERDSLFVVNNGTMPAKWSIEVSQNVIYLKGEQETQWGIGKSMFACGDDGNVFFVPFYDAGDNAKTILEYGQRYSMRIDDDFIPLGNPQRPLELQGQFLQIIYILSAQHISRLINANSIGWAVHPGNPGIFWGFTVDTKDSKERIDSFIKSCLSKAK